MNSMYQGLRTQNAERKEDIPFNFSLLSCAKEALREVTITKSCKRTQDRELESRARAKQPVHSFLGGKGLGIQQGTSVWVGSAKSRKLYVGTQIHFQNDSNVKPNTKALTSNQMLRNKKVR